MTSTATGATMMKMQQIANKLALAEGKATRLWIAYRLEYADIAIDSEEWTKSGCVAKARAVIEFKRDWYDQRIVPFLRGAVACCQGLLVHCLGVMQSAYDDTHPKPHKYHWRVELDGDLDFDGIRQRLTFPVKIIGE